MPPRIPKSGRDPHAPGRRLRLLVLVLALVVGTGVGVWRSHARNGGAGPTDLRYEVTVSDPESGRLDVVLHVDGPRSNIELGFSSTAIAPTAPASKFRVRRANDANGNPLNIEREARGWRVRGARQATIEYEVHLGGGRDHTAYAAEALSNLSREGGRLIGSDVFLFPVHAEAESIQIDYELPPRWTLHHPFRTTRTRAMVPELRALYSSVAGVGPYRTLQREVGPCQIELAVRGQYAFGDDDLMRVIMRIVEHQIDFFGSAPRDRYLFVIDPHPQDDDPNLLHYFGLHFESSMLVLLDSRTNRRRLEGEPASLCAHEFFHNWLGELVTQRGYEMNWFIEGATTLYAYRTRMATRMLDPGRYAEEIAERYESSWKNAPARSSMTLAEAGEIVLQDPELTRLLYTGGLLASIAIDEEIRTMTGGRSSLDDLVLRLANAARRDPEWTLTLHTLETELHHLTGSDFGPWLSRHVYGLEDMPLPAYVTETPRNARR